MKASISWLKELLPALNYDADKIGTDLTNVGLEIDGVENQADMAKGVVAAEVKALRPHPKSDKLRLATVFDGQSDLEVVCGAPNIAEGQKVPYAPLGVHLPAVNITIAPRKIRGVESCGMVCSLEELGLAESSEGILVLSTETIPGTPIAEVLGMDDVTFELSITPNRPDALSHYGIARELSALYCMELSIPGDSLQEVEPSADSLTKVQIDTKACGKYVGRVIKGVKVGPSPEGVQQRLRAIGLRPISNVVDATNIVLMELGHPLHAFDLAKLKESTIIVRQAKDQEKLTLLDDQELKLSSDDMVIADAEVPVALAGVMGGKFSEVDEKTQDVLLESAYFEPSSVRKTAKRYSLSTDASYRFERGTDPQMVEKALDRCAGLIAEWSGGQIHQGQVAVENTSKPNRVVPIRPARATMLLGREVTEAEIKQVLLSLRLSESAAPNQVEERYQSDTLWFESPSFRVDLTIEADLIEEIGRMGDYDALEAEVPPGAKQVWTDGPPKDAESEVRAALVAEGFLETISLAFNSQKQIEAFGLPLGQAVELQNPLGEDRKYMRVSLLPALLKAAVRNQSYLPSITDLRLFEVGHTFAWTPKSGRLPYEGERVGILMRGRRYPSGWQGTKDLLDAYDLKGAVEAVLAAFEIKKARFEACEQSWLHPQSSTQVLVGTQPVGVMGQIHPDLAEENGLDGPSVFLAELDIHAMSQLRGGPARFAQPPHLPPAQRDLSFYVDQSVLAEQVLEIGRSAADQSLLEQMEIFDVYQGKGVPEGQKSIALSFVLRAGDRTLKDQEVDAQQSRIASALADKLGAKLRDG